MSQALSNLSFFLPLSSGKSSNGSTPICYRNSSNSFRPACNGGDRYRKNRVIAMAGENRDNLDHLQRTSHSQQHNHQPQPKKRVAPAAPVGKKSKTHFQSLKLFSTILCNESEINFFFFFFLSQGCGTGFQRRGRFSK